MSRRDWGVALAIWGLNVVLNAPLFRAGETPYRGSIEPGYLSMARFFADNPNPWGWNPTIYCGLPAQATYPPVVPYTAALALRLFPAVDPATLYRSLMVIVACALPATVYGFVLLLCGERRAALWAALLVTFFSPVYGLIRAIDLDRGIAQVPRRLLVLLKYGEGPHMAGLTALPAALLALWKCALHRESWRLVLAAVLLALVVLTNWVAAFALAFCCLMILLTLAGEKTFSVWRALGAAALAYGLACFWITPASIHTTFFNWPADAYNFQQRGADPWLIGGLLALLLAIRLSFVRFPAHRYFCFLLLCAAGFGYLVIGYFSYRADTVPEARRYAVEFDLFLLLALTEAVRLALRHPDRLIRQCAVTAAGLMILAGAGQLRRYPSELWRNWRPLPKESLEEYQTARWLSQQAPEGRVFVTGGTRYALNAWFRLQQVAGTFETGLRNRVPVEMNYHVRASRGDEGEALRPVNLVRRLRAMNVQYLAAHGPNSREFYKEFVHPAKFQGLLEVRDHMGDTTLFAVPGPRLALWVRPEELPASHLLPFPDFTAAMDDASRPVPKARWAGASELHIESAVPPAHLLTVAVNWDPGWSATQDGQPVALQANRLGFLTISARPSTGSRFVLRFGPGAEQIVTACCSASALLFGLLLAVRSGRRAARLS